MSAKINIDARVMATTINRLISSFPNPEDGEPIGPGGPYIRFGPYPDPWRYALQISEVFLQNFTTTLELSKTVAAPEVKKQMTVSLHASVKAFDEWCGNGRRPKWPIPPKRVGLEDKLHKVEIAVIGAQLILAADSMEKGAEAESLFTTGANLMQKGLST